MISDLITIFDIIIVISLVAINYYLFSKKKNVELSWYFIAIYIFCFLVLFPYISIKLEVYIVRSCYDIDALEGFNLAYIWLKWPLYWVLGVIEFIILYLIISRKNE